MRAYLDRFWNRALIAFKAAVESADVEHDEDEEGSRACPQPTHPSAKRSWSTLRSSARFSVFTEGIATWWPPEHHILQAELAETVFEPHVGGHVYDRGVDGNECRWARVLACEPPSRVVFSWDVDTQWQIETDPAKASEGEVRFVPDGPARTRVELEHRNLDRHGDGWEGMRSAVGSRGGRLIGLQGFAHAARTS